ASASKIAVFPTAATSMQPLPPSGSFAPPVPPEPESPDDRSITPAPDGYATIGEVKAAVSIPVVANGDIGSPQAARDVLRATGADAVMIGRAAQGRPWIFREIVHFLATGELLAEPDDAEIAALLRDHLLDHYAFHGERAGVRSARKHVGWYLASRPGAQTFLPVFHALETPEAQLAAVERFLAPGEPIGAPTPAGGAANDTQFRRSKSA
ncbi:MAG: hypothetical protein EHM83_10640, partial [Burkholderiales bacterium]